MTTPAQSSCAFCYRAVWLGRLEPCCDRPEHAGRLVCADVRSCVDLVLSRLHHGAVILTADEARSVVAALETAAEANRNAADVCNDCDAEPAGSLCTTCEYRLTVADEWDALRERIGGQP